MSWFQQQQVEGYQRPVMFAPRQQSIDPSMDEGGASSNPFAYTDGSLLTPWGGHFQAPESRGGGGVAAFKPFEYADFSYDFRGPGSFDEKYQNPGDFKYGDYSSGPDFQAPTAEDMKADPGYEVRMSRGQKALEASKAMQGVLRTGGTAKGLMKFGQEMGSQEYGNVYARKSGEYDRSQGERRFAYGTNRQNATENWDRNVSNARTGYQVRQGAWKDNAAVALESGRLGFDVAQGTYDRNFSKARQGYDDLAAYEQRVASAAASGDREAYNRAMNEYTMARDEFWTNQDRQYNILDREANRGYMSARDYAMMMGDYSTQQGNANAAGTAGAANAWNSAFGNIANTVAGTAMYAARPRQSYGQPSGSGPGGYWPSM